MVTKRSEGIRWEGDTGRRRSPALLLPPPRTSLLAPFEQKAQRRASERGWSFKRQLSNFAHKQVHRKVQQKIFSSETLSRNKASQPDSTAAHSDALCKLPRSVWFSYTWNSFDDVTLAAFFSLFWWATEGADDGIQGSVRGEKGGYGIVFVCVFP